MNTRVRVNNAVVHPGGITSVLRVMYVVGLGLGGALGQIACAGGLSVYLVLIVNYAHLRVN